MIRRIPQVLAVAALATIWTYGAAQAEAMHRNATDLYYNYCVPANDCGGEQIYASPRPVPARVGYTWVTYQPLMPQEYLHKHHRSYVQRNACAGVTRTRVRYGHHGLQSFVPSWMDGKILHHIFFDPFPGYGKYYLP